MKGNDKKTTIISILTLLLLSCSLVSPAPKMDKAAPPPSTTANLRDFTRVVYSQETAHSAETVYCTVETGYREGLVNLRTGKGLTFDVLVIVKESDRLEILHPGEWLNVRTAEGVIGYVHSKYCKTGVKK